MGATCYGLRNDNRLLNGEEMSRGHHVLFEAKLWQAHDVNKQLRNKPGLIIPIRHDVHDELHKEVACMPVPPYRQGQAVLAVYRDNPDDHLRSVYNLMNAFQEAIGHPRVRDAERNIGQLAIHVLETQLPFIREGLLR